MIKMFMIPNLPKMIKHMFIICVWLNVIKILNDNKQLLPTLSNFNLSHLIGSKKHSLQEL